MSLAKVQSALVQAFINGAFFTEAKTQFENVAFSPPSDGSAWAAVWFLPAGNPDVSTLGAGGTDRQDGIFQIDLNFPLNQGTADISAKADALRNTFTAGARFSYSGQTVVIASCGRSPGKPVNGFFKVVVSVSFYAHLTRNIQ